MKNNLFGLNQVYSMIKDYYLIKMPHPTDFSAIDTLNIFVKKNVDENSKISIKENSYIYEGVKEKSFDIFDDLDNILFERYIDFFANTLNINSLIEDIGALQRWLVDEKYVTANGVMTSKMIDTGRLNK
ncbi:hypothetical protein AB7V82_09335 [Providencia stuartii]|uniref:hypothetical protein n=1 Tax=Providencia TaxID=586 RepID=UPI0025A89DDE|nr:hypothetical protein [Providencia rettgeri]